MLWAFFENKLTPESFGVWILPGDRDAASSLDESGVPHRDVTAERVWLLDIQRPSIKRRIKIKVGGGVSAEPLEFSS